MITINNLDKSFREKTLFEDVNLQINNGDRFALVGENGAGKSTLFKILTGMEHPDKGEVLLKKKAVVGYLPQENPPISEKKVLDETISVLETPHPSQIAKAKAILMGLGFSVDSFDRALSTLSGGWAMRVAMAKLLLLNPDLLLLDEPTNHLDLDSILWLRDYLKNYEGAVFIISHDRAFINYFCSAIVAINSKKIKVYRGNYEGYLTELDFEKQRLISAYKRQQEEIRDMQDFVYRNRARVSTAARAQSMIKRLEKMEKIELPEETKKIKIRFPQCRRSGDRVLTLRNISKNYNLKDGSVIKVYDDMEFSLFRGMRAAFVGKNGAGKSTLLKLLAGVIKPDSGNRDLGVNVDTGYFSQHRQECLNFENTVLEEAISSAKSMKEVDIRTALGSFLFRGDDVYKKTSVLSGGEKSRLSLLKILLNPPNCIFLDEPTTHLDISSTDALIDALKDYEGTLCFISHDLYFINSIANNVIHVDGGKITVYPGNYDYFASRMIGKEAEEEVVDKKEEQFSKQPPSDARKEWELMKEKKNRQKRKEKRTKEIEEKLPKIETEIENIRLEMAKPEFYQDKLKVENIMSGLSALENEKKSLEEEFLNLTQED